MKGGVYRILTKLFSTVLSVMYLLQFIAGGISILKEKKGEKDNAHY